MTPLLRTACALAMFATALAICPPTTSAMRDFASWFVRPARLPFAWQARLEAQRGGRADEAFARGQQIAQLVPSWTAGHIAFVYAYVLGEAADAIEDQLSAAARRLDIGLLWLDAARSHAGRREDELLQSAAFLPTVACQLFDGLEQLLAERGGAAGIADRYLREYERRYPIQVARELRMFHMPHVAAALLGINRTREACDVLDTAIERARDARDQQLAGEWAANLGLAVARLRGQTDVDLGPVFDDPRLEPLWPFLR